MDIRPATRAEPSPLRRVAFAMVAGLAAAAVWAGVSIAGGTGGSAGSASTGAGPAQPAETSGPSLVQEGGNGQQDGRDCPNKDGGSNSDGAADASV